MQPKVNIESIKPLLWPAALNCCIELKNHFFVLNWCNVTLYQSCFKFYTSISKYIFKKFLQKRKVMSSIIWSMVLIFDYSWLHSSVKKKNWGFFEEKAGCTSYFGFIALFSEKSNLEFVLVNASFKIDKFFQCYKHEIYILNNFLQMPEVFHYAT